MRCSGSSRCSLGSRVDRPVVALLVSRMCHHHNTREIKNPYLKIISKQGKKIPKSRKFLETTSKFHGSSPHFRRAPPRLRRSPPPPEASPTPTQAACGADGALELYIRDARCPPAFCKQDPQVGSCWIFGFGRFWNVLRSF